MRQFVAYFHFIGWHLISLGVSVDLRSPNIEIHLPGGFVRVGWKADLPGEPRWGWSKARRNYGRS
jgi:hypothetical protein